MDEETLKRNRAKLLDILRGQQSAFDFCWMIAAASECWDDLIDGDNPVKAEDINATFWNLLIELPQNAFYRTHQAALHPLIANSIIHWHAANAMQESGDEYQIERAHFFRYLGVSVWVQVAAIIGGAEYAIEHTAEIWALSSQETLREFKNEMA